MNIFEKNNGTKICAIFSHPDDAELLCYGTLAKYRKENFDITIIIVTGGIHGVAVSEEKSQDLEEIRSSETIEALKEVSFDIRFLGLPDGSVQFTNENVSTIEKILNHLSPSVVITHYTDLSGIDHQDHHIVSKIVKNISNRKSYIKLLLCAEPLKRGTGFNPNLFVRVGEFYKQKLAAINKHKSQFGRIYMTESFHNVRSLVWKNNLGFSDEEYIEAFIIEKAIS